MFACCTTQRRQSQYVRIYGNHFCFLPEEKTSFRDVSKVNKTVYLFQFPFDTLKTERKRKLVCLFFFFYVDARFVFFFYVDARLLIIASGIFSCTYVQIIKPQRMRYLVILCALRHGYHYFFVHNRTD